MGALRLPERVPPGSSRWLLGDRLGSAPGPSRRSVLQGQTLTGMGGSPGSGTWPAPGARARRIRPKCSVAEADGVLLDVQIQHQPPAEYGKLDR